VERAWEAERGAWADFDQGRDIDLPRGGLAGTAAIVDVADGSLMGYRAAAVSSFHTNAARPGALHHAPAAEEPDLGDCDHGDGRCRILFPVSNGPSYRFVFEAGGERGWDAFSALFMAEAIQAEYVTEAGIVGRSEWAITSPTRQFYVDRPVAESVRAPFGGLPFARNGLSCDVVSELHVNREALIGAPSIPTPNSPAPSFCFQSSLPTFNDNGFVGPILGELRRFARNFSTTSPAGLVSNPALAPALASGYTEISFLRVGPPVFINVDTEQTYGRVQRFGSVRGLPLAGIAFRTAINANAQPGLVARYGGAFEVSRKRGLSINPSAPSDDGEPAR
jgi:hypothetical protein